MKITNSDQVKVGDVMKWGGVTFTAVSVREWIVWDNGKHERFLTQSELQDLIDHGFEVTRKVEPVVGKMKGWEETGHEKTLKLLVTFSTPDDALALLELFDSRDAEVTIKPV